MKLELWFPVEGRTLPSDHAYRLFSAVAAAVPALHDLPDWGLHTLRGTRLAPGFIELSQRPRLGFRLLADDISKFLGLIGRTLDVGGHFLRLGPPTVCQLEPSPALSARLVTIKPFLESVGFCEALKRQLGSSDLMMPGASVSLGERNVVTIDGQKIVGFAVRVENLSPEESLRLQTAGVGGRRKLGCGLFRKSEHPLASDSRPLHQRSVC